MEWKEKVDHFEAELRRLLQKPKITVTDAANIEIMVYVSQQSKLIDMPDVSPDAFEKAREFYYTKATELQQQKLRKIYSLLRSIDLMYRCYVTRCNALRFVIERIDSVSWSIQQSEHIENALLDEKLLTKDQIQQFAEEHLNSFSCDDSVKFYKKRLSILPSYAMEALYFYNVYRETMETLAAVYKMPALELLVDDWETYEKCVNAPATAKARIREQLNYKAEEKAAIMDDIFTDLDHIRPETFKLPERLKQDLRRELKLESRKPNAQHIWVMLAAVIDFTNKE